VQVEVTRNNCLVKKPPWPLILVAVRHEALLNSGWRSSEEAKAVSKNLARPWSLNAPSMNKLLSVGIFSIKEISWLITAQENNKIINFNLFIYIIILNG